MKKEKRDPIRINLLDCYLLMYKLLKSPLIDPKYQGKKSYSFTYKCNNLKHGVEVIVVEEDTNLIFSKSFSSMKKEHGENDN